MREPRVMIVDDEPAIARALRPALEGHSFKVVAVRSGAEALTHLEEFAPDIILLDLGLPDIDGTELVRVLREQTTAPIIVLSVRGSEKDKVTALDNGADDYLTKTFGIGELLARIRVALRRVEEGSNTPPPTEPLVIGSVFLDTERHLVKVNDQPVHLSPTEFGLLEVLMRHAGKPVTHRTLLYKVWGPEYESDTQLLRVYIGQLRGKIEARPERPAYIRTEPGIGYRFTDGSESF
jgi:two-component system KDP operon response regulator KdpE